MNCPECGKPIDADQNFCRECGKELIAGNPSWLRVGGLAVLTMMFAGLMATIFGKMVSMKWLSYLGLAVMLTGPFVVFAYLIFRATRPRKRAPDRTATLTPSPTIEQADTTNKLLADSDTDYIPSVVENTTELLVHAKRQKGQ